MSIHPKRTRSSLSIIAILFTLVTSRAPASDVAGAATKPQICDMGKNVPSFTINDDGGLYIAFLELSSRNKISDPYTVFYHDLSDSVKATLIRECAKKRSTNGIIAELDFDCKKYCEIDGKKFVRELGWFKGGHLVGECADVCSQMTAENIRNFRVPEALPPVLPKAGNGKSSSSLGN